MNNSFPFLPVKNTLFYFLFLNILYTHKNELKHTHPPSTGQRSFPFSLWYRGLFYPSPNTLYSASLTYLPTYHFKFPHTTAFQPSFLSFTLGSQLLFQLLCTIKNDLQTSFLYIIVYLLFPLRKWVAKEHLCHDRLSNPVTEHRWFVWQEWQK